MRFPTPHRVLTFFLNKPQSDTSDPNRPPQSPQSPKHRPAAPIRLYDLRHTHAPLLTHEGVHPKRISGRLGHSSLKLTMDTYSHLFDGADQESAARMGEVVRADKRVVQMAARKAS